jgi:hypothetical protein
MTCLTPSSFLSCDTMLPRSLDEAGTAPPRASRYLEVSVWVRVRGGRGGWTQVKQERVRERERGQDREAEVAGVTWRLRAHLEETKTKATSGFESLSCSLQRSHASVMPSLIVLNPTETAEAQTCIIHRNLSQEKRGCRRLRILRRGMPRCQLWQTPA